MAANKTLAELITAVRENVDESVESFWSDVRLVHCLDKAKDRVWLEIRKLKADFFDVTRSSTDGTVTILGSSYNTASFKILAGTGTGTRDYALPPDLNELHLIEVITSGYEHVRFYPRNLSHPDMLGALGVTTGTGAGAFYYALLAASTLRVAPYSDVALDLRLTYVAQPAAFDPAVTTASLDLPHPTYLAVIEFATATALKQDRNPDAAAFEAGGTNLIATYFGAHARQTQEVEIAQSYLEGW